MTAPSPSVDIRTTTTIRLRTAPAWLPEKFRIRLERLRISFRPTKGERRFFRRRKVEPPSVWAPKCRTVTYGPLKGAKWDNSFMPHMRGIMDASFFPSVRIIGNCKVPQSGWSSGADTILGYVADTMPGPVAICYPDQTTTTKRCSNYLQPMFRESARLRPLMTGYADDMNSLQIKLQTMIIHMCWSGSVASLGNISARWLFGDEVDKWVRYPSKKEATSLKLFLERFRSYLYGAKAWLGSTPTDPEGFIWEFLTKMAQVVFDYHIPCPECGTFHKVSDKHIRFGDERDPQKIEQYDLARYVFPCCGVEANDRVRIAALQKGVWHERLRDEDEQAGKVPRELFRYLHEEKPENICFHSPGWICPTFKNSAIAAAFLRGLKDPEEMHYYDNQVKAVAHTPYRQTRKIDTILALRDERPAGLVPGNNQVAALVAGVDTQDDGFYFSIRAFGYGRMLQSWQIRHGEVDSFAALVKVLFEDVYRDAAGLYYPVHIAMMDTGGHRTAEVYDFCRLYPGRVIAYKGASGRKANPKSKTVIDHYPGTKVPIPGGVDLWICDTHYYKDQLAAKLRIKKDDPGSYLYSCETTEEFAAHMCAEYRDKKGLWHCPKNMANHYFDTSVLELIGVDMLGLKYNPPPGEEN